MGWYDDGPRGALGWFSEIVGTLAWWLFSVLVFLAIATLLFLLARFLVAATRAACWRRCSACATGTATVRSWRPASRITCRSIAASVSR